MSVRLPSNGGVTRDSREARLADQGGCLSRAFTRRRVASPVPRTSGDVARLTNAGRLAGGIRAAPEHRKSANEEARQPWAALARLARLQSLQILGHAAAGDTFLTSVLVLGVGHDERDAEYKLRGCAVRVPAFRGTSRSDAECKLRNPRPKPITALFFWDIWDGRAARLIFVMPWSSGAHIHRYRQPARLRHDHTRFTLPASTVMLFKRPARFAEHTTQVVPIPRR
jgi:hypothetical protein